MSAGVRAGHPRGRPWLVPVATLRRRSGSVRDVSISEPIGGMAVSYARVPDDAAVSFIGTVESSLGGVVVRGYLRAPFAGECRRCLDEASGMLEIVLSEVCADEPDPELGYRVEPDWLDLEPIVHDACILELPLAPLCGEACQGLCPDCGVNLNHETCSCVVVHDPDG